MGIDRVHAHIVFYDFRGTRQSFHSGWWHQLCHVRWVALPP